MSTITKLQKAHDKELKRLRAQFGEGFIVYNYGFIVEETYCGSLTTRGYVHTEINNKGRVSHFLD